VTKRRVALLITACTAVLIGLCALIVVHREPTYGGHPLSYWIRRYNDPTSDRVHAEEAIQHIGTNAIPYLLRWMEYQPSGWRVWLANLYDPEFGRGWTWIPRWAVRNDAASRAGEAMVAFHALGPTASAAVPQLGRLARDPKQHGSGTIALAGIGPPAIGELVAILSDTTISPNIRFEATRELNELVYGPAVMGRLGTNGNQAVLPLIRNLSDVDQFVASEAAATLGVLKLQPTSAVPALTLALSNTNALVRASSAKALGLFSRPARSAVPALQTAMGDTDTEVRESASNALVHIAPEALTNSPSQ
jgi:hypothetical protein